MLSRFARWFLFSWLALRALGAEEAAYGPLWSTFRLTLDPGERAEAAGPFWHREERWENWPTNLADPFALPDGASEIQQRALTLAFPPFYAQHDLPGVEHHWWSVLYPLVGYARYGGEYRLQILEVLSFAGGREQDGGDTRRFTLFPFYMQQRSTDQARNYTGLIPFYGRVENRFWRDEVQWIMWPLYVQTRKKDVVTDNYLLPFVHVRHGDRLTGWQVWPFYGTEHRDAYSFTNRFGLPETVGGHDQSFILWPLWASNDVDLGTTNAFHQRAFLPFFNFENSAALTRSNYGWPLGLSFFENHVTGYRQTSFLWPLVIYGRGPQMKVDRFFPLYGFARSPDLQSTTILWPIYREKHKETELMDFNRTGILLFLYTDSSLRDKRDDRVKRRTDLWPLFITRRDYEGNERFQMLAPFEPLIVNNEGVRRLWTPLWSVWATEKSAQTGAASHSFLWNLYRDETAPGVKKCSLLFGMFQYHSTPEGTRGRLFFIPVGKKTKPAGTTRVPHRPGQP